MFNEIAVRSPVCRGQGVFTSRPIRRAWRDIHAGDVHVSLTWDAVSTMYGQYALGLDPKGQY